MIGNFHTHSRYCDGSDTLESLVEQALAANLNQLGFSGHSYTDFDTSYCMSKEATAQYYQEIGQLQEKYRGKITLYRGLELDLYGDTLGYEWDYLLGSVHYVEKNGQYCPVDESLNILKSQVEQFWAGDYLSFARDYFEQVGKLAEIAQKHPGLIVAHLDILTKFQQQEKLFDESCSEYLQPAYAAIDRLLAEGAIFELNSGAMARGYKNEPYPGVGLRQYIKEQGGRFILGSDCHNGADLLYGFDTMRKLAEEEGLILVDSPRL